MAAIERSTAESEREPRRNAAQYFLDVLEPYDVDLEHPLRPWGLVSPDTDRYKSPPHPYRARLEHTAELGAELPWEKESPVDGYPIRFTERDASGRVEFEMARYGRPLFTAYVTPPSAVSSGLEDIEIPETDYVDVSSSDTLGGVEVVCRDGIRPDEVRAAGRETLEVAQYIIEEFAEGAWKSYRGPDSIQEEAR